VFKLFRPHLLAISRPRWGMKNLKRIYSLAPLFPSYDRFTRFSAFCKVFRKNSNDAFSTWNFAHRQVLSALDCSTSLSPNEWFLLDIIEFQRILYFINHSKKTHLPWKFIISWRKHPFGLTFVEQSSADETYLWAKFQVENTSFEFFRNTL
jgi:hypothetical protein